MEEFLPEIRGCLLYSEDKKYTFLYTHILIVLTYIVEIYELDRKKRLKGKKRTKSFAT